MPGPGVPRREVGGGLEKLSGISFQLLIFEALDGGGIDGEALKFREGGPTFGAAPYLAGGIVLGCWYCCVLWLE